MAAFYQILTASYVSSQSHEYGSFNLPGQAQATIWQSASPSTQTPFTSQAAADGVGVADQATALANIVGPLGGRGETIADLAAIILADGDEAAARGEDADDAAIAVPRFLAFGEGDALGLVTR